MSIAKRAQAAGFKGELPTAGGKSSSEWLQANGMPLPLEPGDEVRESRCPGMVGIHGAKQTRYAWAERVRDDPAPAPEPPVQGRLF